MFQVVHGAERGEPAALLLSPLRPAFRDPSDADLTQNGSQFTFFLTAPLSAFCQLVGLSYSDTEAVSQFENSLYFLKIKCLKYLLICFTL